VVLHAVLALECPGSPPLPVGSEGGGPCAHARPSPFRPGTKPPTLSPTEPDVCTSSSVDRRLRLPLGHGTSPMQRQSVRAERSWTNCGDHWAPCLLAQPRGGWLRCRAKPIEKNVDTRSSRRRSSGDGLLVLGTRPKWGENSSAEGFAGFLADPEGSPPPPEGQKCTCMHKALRGSWTGDNRGGESTLGTRERTASGAIATLGRRW
jgi:hypothetical protein